MLPYLHQSRIRNAGFSARMHGTGLTAACLACEPKQRAVPIHFALAGFPGVSTTAGSPLYQTTLCAPKCLGASAV